MIRRTSVSPGNAETVWTLASIKQVSGWCESVPDDIRTWSVFKLKVLLTESFIIISVFSLHFELSCVTLLRGLLTSHVVLIYMFCSFRAALRLESSLASDLVLHAPQRSASETRRAEWGCWNSATTAGNLRPPQFEHTSGPISCDCWAIFRLYNLKTSFPSLKLDWLDWKYFLNGAKKRN